MGKLIDLIGCKFGRWIVLEQSDNCKHGHTRWKCLCSCGKYAVVNGSSLRNGTTKSCGCFRNEMFSSRRGEANSKWKGGRCKRGDYIIVHKHRHPKANSRGYVYEHVLVMSEFLGRLVEKGESVHHLNGVRDDNRIENLELWSSSHPSGQRITDKVAWAKEILSKYAPEALA